MKKFLYTLILLLSVYQLNAQQQYTYTNYLLNQFYYNPAFAGSEHFHRLNAGIKKQWAGFEGAPTTFHLNFYGSYKNLGTHGYGASVVSDKTGLMQRTGFHLNYVYHLRLNDNFKLGFGVKPGYLLYNIKLYDAQLADYGDQILTGNVLATNAFDLSSGLYLYSKKFYVSLSMQQILTEAVKFTDFNDGLSHQYTFITGYNYQVKKTHKDSTEKPGFIEKVLFQPSVMVNYVDPITPQISGMLKMTYDERYWLGFSYRSQDAFSALLGIDLNNRVSFGYAYDFPIGQVSGYSSGTHEIQISFIPTKKAPNLDDKDEELNNGIFEENKKELRKEK